ncbi:MAG: uroporphyrinogen-III synthase [Acidobacteriota bacterium]
MTESGGSRRGTVYLVGWGPGEAGLETRHGLRLLQEMDLLVSHQPLPGPAVSHLPSGAQRFEGSRTEVLRRASSAAAAGRSVVWLFRGDPYLDGCGAWAATQLSRTPVPIEVVCGVPLAVRGAIAAGVPLDPETPEGAFFLTSADALLKASMPAVKTLLVSNVTHTSRVMDRLLSWRYAPETPLLLVLHGGSPRQRLLRSTLGDGFPEEERTVSSAILVVGSVLQDSQLLSWFRSRPLHDRGVVVTRPRAQSGPLIEQLRQAGARVIEFPTIQVEMTSDTQQLDAALNSLRRNAWIVFTSVNGVEMFFARLHELGMDARSMGGIKIAAIGPATAAALTRHGVHADTVPARYQAEGLLEALGGESVAGTRILLPRAQAARDVLPETLRRRGAIVDVVPIYRTTVPAVDVDGLRNALDAGLVDVVIFTSSSTVRHFVGLFRPDEARSRLVKAGAVAACIGPVTAATARESGFPVAIEASQFTVPGLLAALETYYGRTAARDRHG